MKNHVTFASVYNDNEVFQGWRKLKANFTHIYRDEGGTVNTEPGFLLKVNPSPTESLYLWRERQLASGLRK